MHIVFVSTGTFQFYLLHNIRNCHHFGNFEISVITDSKYTHILKTFNSRLAIDTPHIPPINILTVETIYGLDKGEEGGEGECKGVEYDLTGRDLFFQQCSKRFFHLYSAMQRQLLSTPFIHLENDVMIYMNMDDMQSRFRLHADKGADAKLCATFDNTERVVPGIIYIPNLAALAPIIRNYDHSLTDMQNLGRHDERTILPLPIWPLINGGLTTKFNTNFPKYHCIFDAAAIGQYIGGVDPSRESGDTRGYISPDCVYKYNYGRFQWVQVGVSAVNEMLPIYAPFYFLSVKSPMTSNNQQEKKHYKVRVANLHIHCKRLDRFMGHGPMEHKYCKLNIVREDSGDTMDTKV